MPSSAKQLREMTRWRNGRASLCAGLSQQVRNSHICLVNLFFFHHWEVYKLYDLKHAIHLVKLRLKEKYLAEICPSSLRFLTSSLNACYLVTDSPFPFFFESVFKKFRKSCLEYFTSVTNEKSKVQYVTVLSFPTRTWSTTFRIECTALFVFSTRLMFERDGSVIFCSLLMFPLGLKVSFSRCNQRQHGEKASNQCQCYRYDMCLMCWTCLGHYIKKIIGKFNLRNAVSIF